MPEPISSSSSVPWTPAYEEPPPEEPTAEGEPDEELGPLARYVKEASQPTDNNAQRTTVRQSTSPYADAGVTSSGDSVYAGAAFTKTHDPNVRADVEAVTISGQVGAQNEAQVGLARVSVKEGGTTGSMEVFTLRASAGVRNDDGSVGLNAGVGATAAGVEGTYAFEGGSSFTVGAAASFGMAGSIGDRDIDGDGARELCAKFSGAVFTVGFCVEQW
jgi:hypothetical protein